jgi:hypothetical protein
MMGSVYSLADNVVAWIGPEADGSSDALNIIQHLAYHVEVDWSTWSLRSLSRSDEPEWADLRVLLPYKSGELDPVCAFLTRPYFERVWIRQEVGLAKCVLLQCGQQSLPWKDFQMAVCCLYWKSTDSGAMADGNLAIFQKSKSLVMDTCRAGTSEYTYHELRWMLRQAKCRDRRDRIFAVLTLLDKNDQELGIQPDYTLSTEEVYTQVAHQYLKTKHSLALLETCELSSKCLDIPSWVPDWSSNIQPFLRLEPFWSACGWISAQATILDENEIRVAGVEAARVEQIVETADFGLKAEALLQILRNLQPSVQALAVLRGSFSSSVESHCRALTVDRFSNICVPNDDTMPDLEATMEALGKFWSPDTADEVYVELETKHKQFLYNLRSWTTGRCFFSATNGHVGLAPIGTQPGDVICVLLGYDFPVVLRAFSESRPRSTWQVVGVCNVPDLMNGEAIYGGKLPKHYRRMWDRYRKKDYIDGWNVALYDSQTKTVRADPAEVLTEIGIKVEIYQRYPHLLEVLPETLRAAGVPLQDFNLV